MAKIDDSVKKKVPELRFPGFTDDWEERKLNENVENIGTGRSSFKAGLDYSEQTPYEVLGSTSVISYSDSFDHSGNFVLTARVGANAGNLYKHSGNVKISDNTVYIQSKNLEFIFYLLTKYDLKKLAFGTGQPLIKASELKNLKLFSPKTFGEQQKIGSFFKHLDDTIALHQRKLDLLKEQKKGYLQKMFPKNGAKVPELRFAGFADAWGQRKLIDVKDNEDRYSYTGGPFGSDLKSSDYTEIGVRIIQLQNIGDGKFVNDYKIYTSEEKARSLNSNLIYPGEIIIAKMADPLARATILPKIEPKYLMASDGIRLKINTDYFDNYYILTLINSDVFRKEALNNSTGTTRKRIGLVTLGNLPMMIPSFEEQQKIGSFFKQLDETIDLHQRKLDLLKEQKKGFLQKMFV
ncbi:restriction endonuclease subunit S (plasmid) [Streptococcus dysgalactiae]|uniref:Restriction endonuclease subunit S n=2 Tax=Streptococcus TaxID=1301 RepID=A0AAE4HY47_9STRE|nr:MULTISPECIES: restriction endonuclease subunit S [Streptococcus]MDT2732799.1 restriction endonuclease subunit S [Streptococcus parauberis]WAI94212.1 restriction endonuclease subunit S [Streptococcus dysgalactiae]WHL24731.1 restriction endonuclease subunit S [Streptococcus iniae]